MTWKLQVEGLAYKLHEMACEVYILVVTNGNKGCFNSDICGNSSNAEIAAIRKQEQYNSGKILGIPPKNMYFLDYEDCVLKLAAREELSRKLV